MTSERPGSRSLAPRRPPRPPSRFLPPQIAAPAIASRPTRPWLWIVATLALLAALAAVLPTSSLVRRGAPAGSPDSYELAIAAPPGAQFEVGANSGNVILSPDGTRIAFVASTDKAATIWIRSLAADDARSVPGTENAFNPFWSPDGRSIGFFANGKVWAVKIAAACLRPSRPPTAAAAARGARTARSSLPSADPPCHVSPFLAARSAR